MLRSANTETRAREMVKAFIAQNLARLRSEI